MQDCSGEAQTIRDVLDGAWSQCHHRPPLLPAQRQVRGLLGGSKSASLTLKSHTRATPCTCFRNSLELWRNSQNPAQVSRTRLGGRQVRIWELEEAPVQNRSV